MPLRKENPSPRAPTPRRLSERLTTTGWAVDRDWPLSRRTSLSPPRPRPGPAGPPSTHGKTKAPTGALRGELEDPMPPGALRHSESGWARGGEYHDTTSSRCSERHTRHRHDAGAGAHQRTWHATVTRGGGMGAPTSKRQAITTPPGGWGTVSKSKCTIFGPCMLLHLVSCFMCFSNVSWGKLHEWNIS